jgi:N6-adenosine-specific RNA methylase IME4
MTRYRTIVADPPWPVGDFPRWGELDGTTTRPYDVMTLDAIRALPVSNLSYAGAHLHLWTIADHLEATWGVARAWGFEPAAVLTWCKPLFGLGLGGKFVNTTEFAFFCRDVAGIRRITSYLADCADANGVSNKAIDREFGTNGMAGHWLSRSSQPAIPPPDYRWDRLKVLVGADGRFDDEVAAYHEHKGEAPRVESRWFQWPRGEHSAKPEAFLDLVESVSPAPRVELFARRARFGWDYWGNESLNTANLGDVA